MIFTIFLLLLLYVALELAYWQDGEHISFKYYAAFWITALVLYNIVRHFV